MTRKYARCDESILFDRLAARTLLVIPCVGWVYTRRSINSNWQPMATEANHDGRPFYRLYDHNRRRRFAANKLVWLSVHGPNSIPAGYDIDHEDCNTAHNAIGNLRLLPESINRSCHRDTKLREAQWD